MPWIVFALGSAVALAFADLCAKLASGKVSNSLGLLLYGSCTFLAGVGWVAWQMLQGEELRAQPSGVAAALGMGVSFSVVAAGLYLTFGAGAPVSMASPLIRLGGLVLASAVGLSLFGEPLTGRYLFGMALSCTGVYLIITR